MRNLGAGILVCVLAACGDDRRPGSDASPGTMADASPADASPADASPADASPADAAMPDGGDGDAGPGGVAIDDVVTGDGFTQVRQGGAAQLVITGSGLGQVDTVAVGELDAILVSAAADEVRADLSVPHGTAPGMRPLTLSTAGGSATLRDAIELTVYVVAADAAPGGRGTYQSPLTLCELEGALPLAGDAVALLAGEHVCDREPLFPIALSGGMTVAGQGADVTLVRGEAQSFAGFVVDSLPGFPPTTFRGLSIAAPEPFDAAISLLGSTTFIAQDLAIAGPGLLVPEGSSAVLNLSGFEQTGPGIGIDGVGELALTLSSSRFTACDTGVLIRSGAAAVSGTVFDTCALGLQAGLLPPGDAIPPQVEIDGCQFLDDEVGVSVALGATTVIDSTFRDLEATIATSAVGLQVGFGTAQVMGGEIEGMDQVGVLVSGSPTTEGFATARLDGVTITGGPVGVELAGFPDDEHLSMRDSVVRDQTVASVRLVADGSFADADLGNGGGPGGNQLSVVSGVALLDERTDSSGEEATVDCTGMTLNGRSYAGQTVQGPASQQPDYQVAGDGVLQF